MKLVRRYLFTFLLLSLALLSIVGWWHSSREWSAWVAETPFGIFKIQSESSIFGIGGQVMTHEHRWACYSNADSITGDRMRWLLSFPDLKIGGGIYLIILPYWELAVVLLAGSLIGFVVERSRVRKRQK